MQRRIRTPLIAAGVLLLSQSAYAQSTASFNNEEGKSLALFFRSTSPPYIWGQNGVLTTPAAVTVGPWHVSLATNLAHAGSVQGESVVDAKEALVLTTGGDLEFGYSRKDLVWIKSFERTPLAANLIYLKYALINVKSPDRWWIPKIGVGGFGFQVNEQQNFNLADTFIDAFAVASEIIRFYDMALRLHGGVNVGLMASRATRPYFFGGLDFTFLDGWVTVAGEHVGGSQQVFDGIWNAGAAVNLFGFGQAGLLVYNVGKPKDANILLNLSLNLALGDYFESLVGDGGEDTATGGAVAR